MLLLKIIALPVTNIFNCSFPMGMVLTALKLAKIVPIFNQGLFPYFSKLIEKLTHYQVYKYVTRMKIHEPSHSFIHSFIMEIYIAPLQDYYSEALPTLARLKRRVLRLE